MRHANGIESNSSSHAFRLRISTTVMEDKRDDNEEHLAHPSCVTQDTANVKENIQSFYARESIMTGNVMDLRKALDYLETRY